MVRTILLAGVIALAGCAQLSRAPDKPGAFTLSYRQPPSAGDPVSTPAAGDWLARRAAEACPRGYEKLDEVVVPGNPPTVTWQVRCL